MQSVYILGGIPFLTAAVLSSVLTGLVRRFAASTGFVARSTDARFHDQPRSLGGGIAIFLSLLGTVGGGLLFVRFGLSWVGNPLHETIAPHAGGIVGSLGKLGALGTGAVIVFLLGLADDLYHLSPSTKLILETAAAAVAVFGGLHFSLFLESDGLLASGVRVLVSVAWVVGLTNAFNLLDNMDGQCAGIAGVLALSLGILGFQTGQIFLGSFLFAVTGAILGFFVYNAPPAEIFAGDSGSLTIGYLLATAPLVFTFMQPRYNSHVYLSPLILFAVPFYDTASVLWIRFREGRPLFEPDTCHFSHRLVERGLSERGALGVTMLFSMLTGLFTLIIYQSTQTGANLVFVATILLMCLISLLEGPRDEHDLRTR